MTQKEALQKALEEYLKAYEYACNIREGKSNTKALKYYLIDKCMEMGICLFIHKNYPIDIRILKDWKKTYPDGEHMPNGYNNFLCKTPIYCKSVEEIKEVLLERIIALRKRLKLI